MGKIKKITSWKLKHHELEELSKMILVSTTLYDSNENIIEEKTFNESGAIKESSFSTYNDSGKIVENIFKNHIDRTVQKTAFEYENENLKKVKISCGGENYSVTVYKYDTRNRLVSRVEKTVDDELISFNEYYYGIGGYTKIEKEYNSGRELTRIRKTKLDSFGEEKETIDEYPLTGTTYTAKNKYLKEGHLLERIEYEGDKECWRQTNTYDASLEVVKTVIQGDGVKREMFYDFNNHSNLEVETIKENGEIIEIRELITDENGWYTEVRIMKKLDEFHTIETNWKHENEYQ